jgi:hypothetical protein
MVSRATFTAATHYQAVNGIISDVLSSQLLTRSRQLRFPELLLQAIESSPQAQKLRRVEFGRGSYDFIDDTHR